MIIAVGGFFPGSGMKLRRIGRRDRHLRTHRARSAAGGQRRRLRSVRADCDLRRREFVRRRPRPSVAHDLSSRRRDGGRGLSRCECDAPLACDTNANRCYASVAEGASCDRLGTAINRCADGFTCVSPYRGPRTGVCRANGSVALSACDATACAWAPVCVSPIPGGTPSCVQQVASGAACSTFDRCARPVNGACPAKSARFAACARRRQSSAARVARATPSATARSSASRIRESARSRVQDGRTRGRRCVRHQRRMRARLVNVSSPIRPARRRERAHRRERSAACASSGRRRVGVGSPVRTRRIPRRAAARSPAGSTSRAISRRA